MKYLIFLLIIFVLAFALFPSFASAQGLKNAAGILKTQVAPKAGVEGVSDVGTVVGTAINVALGLVGLIFMVLMIYAGYLWMTAHGEEEPIKKAQKIIVGAIIGLVIVVGAYAITILVTSKFTGGGESYGCCTWKDLDENESYNLQQCQISTQKDCDLVKSGLPSQAGVNFYDQTCEKVTECK